MADIPASRHERDWERPIVPEEYGVYLAPESGGNAQDKVVVQYEPDAPKELIRAVEQFTGNICATCINTSVGLKVIYLKGRGCMIGAAKAIRRWKERNEQTDALGIPLEEFWD